jgi:hypothetical protein
MACFVLIFRHLDGEFEENRIFYMRVADYKLCAYQMLVRLLVAVPYNFLFTHNAFFILQVSKNSGTNSNISYFSCFYLQVKVKG